MKFRPNRLHLLIQLALASACQMAHGATAPSPATPDVQPDPSPAAWSSTQTLQANTALAEPLAPDDMDEFGTPLATRRHAEVAQPAPLPSSPGEPPAVADPGEQPARLSSVAAPVPGDAGAQDIDIIERAWLAGAFDHEPSIRPSFRHTDQPTYASPAAGAEEALTEPAQADARHVPDWLPWICHAVEDPACGSATTAQAEPENGMVPAPQTAPAPMQDDSAAAAGPMPDEEFADADEHFWRVVSFLAQERVARRGVDLLLDETPTIDEDVLGRANSAAVEPVEAQETLLDATDDDLAEPDANCWRLVTFLAQERAGIRGGNFLPDEEVEETAPRAASADPAQTVTVSAQAQATPVADEDFAAPATGLAGNTVAALPPPSLQPPATEPASADQDSDAARESSGGAFGEGAVKVAAAELDNLRGGFETPQGKFAFGFERAVYVNGQLFATQTLNLGDLSQLRGGQLNPETVLVQNGAGNVAALNGVAAGSAPLVIQNSLNNQNIRTVTTINAVVPAMSVMRGITQMRSITQGVLDAAGRR